MSQVSTPHAIGSLLCAAALLAAGPSLWRAGAIAQQGPKHLNPMVEKLSQGKPVFGIATDDFSMENARAIARADIDYVRIEQEHAPMNFEKVRDFLIGMIDKTAILKKGNAQVNVAPVARFAPYGHESNAWIVKQALDIGLMGVMFNQVDTPEQAIAAVRAMRYPQRRTSKHPLPQGIRGSGASNALWFWGVSNAEYFDRADVWPLNPDGDLLCIIMIESVEGVKNLDAIAAVPGVGMLFPGAAGDLGNSLGVPPGSPEREQGLQTVLKACLRHNVPCGVLANANDIPRRIKEGWKYLEVPGGAISAAGEAALKAGRAALQP